MVAGKPELRVVTWGQGACPVCEGGDRWLYVMGGGRLIICGPCIGSLKRQCDALDLERMLSFRRERAC